jgi:hypothetical protein
MSRRRELLFAFLVPIATVVIVLLLAEIVLRFLPVRSGLRTMQVDAANPVFRSMPNRPFVFSMHWNLQNVTRGRVNNVGYVNDQDYRREDALPLVAIVGDSYIEAQMVHYAGSAQGRLAHDFADKFRVYSFAGQGAPLSQYLIWGRQAVREYGARAIVFNIVGNDFDESLLSYKIGPGFWHYVPEDGSLRLRLVEYRPGRVRKIVRESALARYMVFNVEWREFLARVRVFGELILGKATNPAPRYFGNTNAEADPTRVRDSFEVIDAFFRDLPTLVGLSPENVLFMVDGFRYPEAAAEGRGSYFDLMRRALLAKAAALGYEAIDLDTLFLARHRSNGEKFDFYPGAHWNSNGHGIMAEAVASSRLFARLRQKRR